MHSDQMTFAYPRTDLTVILVAKAISSMVIPLRRQRSTFLKAEMYLCMAGSEW